MDLNLNFKKNYLFFLSLLTLIICLLGCVTESGKKQSQQNAKNDTYVENELAIQHGTQLFNKHCASCHDFNENVIGPNLGGVTSKVSKEWLIGFIKKPRKTIESGDERATALYRKYQVFMPSFDYLKEQDLEDLLGFVHKYSESETKSQRKRPGAIINPIPEKIQESDLILILEEFIIAPPSSESNPLARINKLTTINKKKGERMFMADLRGTLYEVVDSTVHVFLDLKKELVEFVDAPGYGSGFGSFDFHPEFTINGLFYTTHTEPSRASAPDFAIPDTLETTLQWVLTEWKLDSPSLPYFSGKKRELLRVDMLGSAHGFQELTFNPVAKKGDEDYGLLYLGIGDGGAIYAKQPSFVGNTRNIWGTVIRIDPLGNTSDNGKYGIPKDNPFVNDANAVGEIWSFGFRNPHRITWDLGGTGKIFVSNIGRHSVEEVNLLGKGLNYGWPIREGTFLFDASANTEVVYPLPQDDDGFTYPIIQFDHDEGAAISGGFVYSGHKIPLLRDKYIFGDIPKGTLFLANVAKVHQGDQASVYKIGIELNGVVTDLSELLHGERVDLRLGMDKKGALFILTKYDGKVYKIIGCKEKSDYQ